MQLSHLTPDTPRRPVRVSPDERVEMALATSPVGAHQSGWLDYHVQAPRDRTSTRSDPSDERTVEGRVPGRWTHNEVDTSCWQALLGPLPRGTGVAPEASPSRPALRAGSEPPSAGSRRGRTGT